MRNIVKMYFIFVLAFEKKAAGENHRILDRDREGMFQRRQLQLADGHNRRTEHVADQPAQKDGKSRLNTNRIDAPPVFEIFGNSNHRIRI